MLEDIDYCNHVDRLSKGGNRDVHVVGGQEIDYEISASLFAGWGSSDLFDTVIKVISCGPPVKNTAFRSP